MKRSCSRRGFLPLVLFGLVALVLAKEEATKADKPDVGTVIGIDLGKFSSSFFLNC